MSGAARLLLALPALILVALGILLLRSGGGTRSAPALPRVHAGHAFPRTVELPGGLRLSIEAPPERILLANASAVDLVSPLVGPERLVALPEQALRFSRLADEPGGFAGLPRFDRFEAEVVLAFDPDLVICDPWAAVETVARLRELDVPVLTLPQVHRIEDVRESIGVLGAVLGAEERARAVIVDLDVRIARLAASSGRRRGLTALSYSNAGAGGWSAGEGTTNHEVIRLAGLRNLTAESGRSDHVRLSFEDLITLDPDFIVVGDFRPGQEEGATRRFLRKERALSGLRAVREERVIVLPARLFSASSQELVGCAERLAAEVDRWLAERGGR